MVQYSVPPSGAAGGDLSGTYPNPTVASAAGAFNVGGNETVGGTLAVTGNTTLSSKLTVGSGAVELPAGEFLPADHGYLAWGFDPTLCIGSTSAVNGTLYLAQIVLRSAKTITNLTISLASAAVSPTANQNFLALYDASGTRQAVTAAGAIDTATASTGPLTQAVVTPYAAAAGKYWIAVLLNAGTPAAFARATSFQSTPNAGLGASTLRWAVNGTGLTSTPASITPASNTSSGNITLWAAAS